jgi:hypothetical protein
MDADKTDIIFSHIRAALKRAEGEAQAVTLAQLADYAGTSRRVVEQLLEERLEDLGFAVVSGSPGLWRPASADEVNHYLASLQSRLRKLAVRRKKVKRMAARDGFARAGKEHFENPPARQREFLFESMEAGQWR